MKRRIIIILFFTATLISCSVQRKIKIEPNAGKTSFDLEGLNERRHELQLSYNRIVAEEFIRLSLKTNITPSIGNFGWDKIEQYWSEDKILMGYRNNFEKADKALREFIYKNDREYKEIEKLREENEINQQEFNKRKHASFNILSSKYPNEYGKLREDRDYKLLLSNCKTMEYIINDYYKKNIIFPIDWIPKKAIEIINMDSRVFNILKEIQIIDAEILRCQ